VGAPGGLDQSEQHADRRGLARPVWPEEPVDRAAGDVEVDAVDRDLPAARSTRAASSGRLVSTRTRALAAWRSAVSVPWNTSRPWLITPT
jgi:hypothetical protein